jgi:allantoin racemase
MRIKAVLASSSEVLAEGLLPSRRRVLAPGTEITIVAPTGCPSSTESEEDELVAASAVYSEVAAGAEEGYDAVTIDCTLEPGLKAAKKTSSIPVVGAGEAALCLSLLFGERFSVIMPIPKSIGPMVAKIRQMGLWERCASVRSVNLHVLDLGDYDRTLDDVTKEARLATETDGADVIVLGCTAMGAIADGLAVRLGIPVIEPATAALKLAEALAAPGWRAALMPAARESSAGM